MLKNMKAKALAVLAALAMMIGLGAVAIAPAYAAGNTGTLTVTSTNPEANGKTVSAWRMFDITVSGSGEDASYGYTLTDAWHDFFIGGSAPVTIPGITEQNLSQKAYEYVKDLESGTNTDEYNDGDVADFAKKAADWAQDTSHSESMNRVKLTDVSFSGSENSYSATFSNVPFGYYVVRPQSGSTDVSTPIRGTDAMLVPVVSSTEAATVTMKSEYPTVDKTIIDEPGSDQDGTAASDAQIGDTVWFQLESKVPDMSEYSSYVFKFHDTLSNGLTFNEDSVTVKVGDAKLTKESDYTVSQSGQNITIDLTSLYSKYKDQAGVAIVVTYSATLNKNAVIGNNGNENSATVEYTNNPTTGGTGSSQPDITKTHTFEFTIDKYTGDYNGDATRLSGAQFHIVKGETAGDGTTMKFQQKTAGDAMGPLVVIPLQSEGTELTPLTTPESGKITVSGLDDGTYWIVEDKAPDGYNKLTEPIKVVITANYDETTGELTSHTVTYGDESTAAGNNVIPVQNNKGTLLPGTGGMGTVLFTVAGVALIALGVVWSLKRSKSAGRRH